MSLQEYEEFYTYSVNNHAEELMQEKNLSVEKALDLAKEEFEEMLPNGLATGDNYLMIVEDGTDGRSVGFIWYLIEKTEGVKQVFLCDFLIKEDERRKGYASIALKDIQENAVKFGCKESVLFVSKDNAPAINLYIKNGYTPFKEFEYGTYMKKTIS